MPGTAGRGRKRREQGDGEDGGTAQTGPHMAVRRLLAGDRVGSAPRGSGPGGRPPGPGNPGYAVACGQVSSIHLYVVVGSPFGYPGGAVMLRIGTVMTRFWSSTGKG